MAICMYFMIINYLNIIKKQIIGFFRKLLKEESGMGTIEIIIIMAVLVALALIFRTFIMDLASSIFDKIEEKTDAAIGSL